MWIDVPRPADKLQIPLASIMAKHIVRTAFRISRTDDLAG